jgi:hypothetical protein
MYKSLTDSINSDLANLEAIKAASEHLPELRDLGNPSSCAPVRSIVCNAPYSPALIREHQNALEAAGWTFSREYDYTANAQFVREFGFEQGVHLTIFYTPDVPGATCKVNIVGYEQRPVYERVCLEA